MKIGINGLSLMKDLNKDFHKTAEILKEAGCNYIEPLSDWCADPKMLDFYASLSGERSNWDPENAKKRIAILREYGIGVIGMFVFTDYIEEQAQELGEFCKENGITPDFISYTVYLRTVEEVVETINQKKEAWHYELFGSKNRKRRRCRSYRRSSRHCRGSDGHRY